MDLTGYVNNLFIVEYFSHMFLLSFFPCSNGSRDWLELWCFFFIYLFFNMALLCLYL